MAKKPKFEVEGAEVVEQAIEVAELTEEQIAIQNELGDIAEEEVALKARLVEIAARRRELGVTKTSNRGPRGVGAYVKELIHSGKTNEEILIAVRENFPSNNTNANCINWYRNAIKQWGPEGKRPSAKKNAVVETIGEAVESLGEAIESFGEAIEEAA